MVLVDNLGAWVSLLFLKFDNRLEKRNKSYFNVQGPKMFGILSQSVMSNYNMCRLCDAFLPCVAKRIAIHIKSSCPLQWGFAIQVTYKLQLLLCYMQKWFCVANIAEQFFPTFQTLKWNRVQGKSMLGWLIVI